MYSPTAGEIGRDTIGMDFLITALSYFEKFKECPPCRLLWQQGLVAVRIDRNAGRIIVMCREVWTQLHDLAYSSNARYRTVDVVPSSDDTEYARKVLRSFKDAVDGPHDWLGRVAVGNGHRPQSYWTVKQKSLIMTTTPPVVKLRPIITHSSHPMRSALKRVARALALIVVEARSVVLKHRPSHYPMWEMHQGITS